VSRLLTAVSAPQADEVGKMKMELRRPIFDEQVRGEKRKSAGTPIESQATGNLKPWREVGSPRSWRRRRRATVIANTISEVAATGAC
jgi:hypothetical protein